MSLPACVNCKNKKDINLTTNRLVTENCGHVKCVECLIQEKSGCVACLNDNGQDSALSFVNADLHSPEGEKKSTELNGAPPKRIKPETSHIQILNDESGKYYLCTLCKKKFHARSQVGYHAYCNGQRKPYQCPECNKSFATHSHFKYHMSVHRNERTYSCADCGESFFQMSKLQRHRIKHTKEKKYSCPECKKAFPDYTSLRKHAVTHSEERPYACDDCGRKFRDPSNYNKHRAKHSDNKCPCDVCGRSVCATETARHALAHSRRAFQCARCPQAFHNKKDMRRHVAVHSDSKPFRCKVCDRRFRRKDNLERHIRNTHPDHAPAAAVECDQDALTDLLTTNPQEDKKNQQENMLKILNPLPPLPQEVIQKHMRSEIEIELTPIEQDVKNVPEVAVPEVRIQETIVEEKSYIIEANNARESVIFGPVGRKDILNLEKKSNTNQENEYVHKIRKANILASQKDIRLPPIDEKKIIELEHKSSQNSLAVEPRSKNVEVYKKILYERVETTKMAAVSSSEVQRDDVDDGGKCNKPEMHWRRKMKLETIKW